MKDNSVEVDVPTWLFGYGSLIWRQDFPWLDRRSAYITGWSRRFWQGATEHRGVVADPGRVLTLVESPGERCYGSTFLIEPKIFEQLDYREKNGYERHVVDISFGKKSVPGITYIAFAYNPTFLGDAPMDEIAVQINRCFGSSGTNAEYLLELAKELRNLKISDQMVFELETLVLEKQAKEALTAGPPMNLQGRKQFELD